MEFCTLCEKPCISDKHFRVIDIKNNKAEKESVMCQACGLTYIQATFQNPSLPPEPKAIQVKPDPPMTKLHVVKTPEELLSVMMGMGIVSKAPKKPVPEQPCPDCGMEGEEFIKRGRFGCQSCYTHFQETYLSMADVFQNGARKHVGKRPKNFVEAERKESLQTLKLMMASAVEKEQYEVAAKIRDRIKNRVNLPEDEQAS